MFDEVMQYTTAEVESETSFDYDNLFDLTEENSEEETAEETTEEEETEEEETEDEEETEETAEETTEEEETVDFKYLGQTSKLNKAAIEKIGFGMGKSTDEVVALLQKGANYENTPVHKLIDKYAEANGMGREEYIKFLEDGLPGLAENIQKNKVLSEHPDWDEEKVNLAVQLNLSKMNSARAEKEEKAKKDAEFELYKPHIEFLRKYPEVTEYPEEVAADIEKGISPIVAYEAYQQRKEYAAKLEELNKKTAKEAKKEKNKAKTTGSLKENDGDVETDWFSEGLFG
jgi:hypothetical protein